MSYNTLLHVVLRTRFSDAQCGFKAIRADRAHQLLPLVRDRAWFFDTELLVLAERAGLRIHEVPVDWVDDPDSRVDIVSTAIADLRGVIRLAARPRSSRFAGQVLRFLAIGVLSTVAYALLYLVFRGLFPAQAANALALLATAVANTAANRRFTFAILDGAHWFRHQLQGLAVFGLALGLTASSLLVLHAAGPASSAAGADRAGGREPGRDDPQVRPASLLGVPSPEAATTTLTATSPSARVAGRTRALLRGRTDDPAWVRPTLLGILAATAILYTVDLAASGYANGFYSAAVEAGSKSWKAFFVVRLLELHHRRQTTGLVSDGPSARLFGVSSWTSSFRRRSSRSPPSPSCTAATVRRASSPPAALLAAVVCAYAPVAALMFRFNNPDALLTLLLVGAAYAVTWRSAARTRWLVLAAVLIGARLPDEERYRPRPRLRGRLPVRRLSCSLTARSARAASGVAIACSRSLVGGDRRRLAGFEPSLHRRLGQQHSQPDLRLQRLRPLTGNERGSVVGGQVFGSRRQCGGRPDGRKCMWV